MAKLPFVVEPRLRSAIDKIGNEEIGVFEIERKGYLTVQERNFVQQVEKTDQGTSSVLKLSRKIAQEFGIGLERAYNMVLASVGYESKDSDDELQKEVELKFSEEISDMIQGLTLMQARSEMVEALCMLIHRIDDTFTPEDLKDVHPDLIDELSKFYKEELSKSTERLKQLHDEQTAISAEEIEKKHPRKKIG